MSTSDPHGNAFPPQQPPTQPPYPPAPQYAPQYAPQPQYAPAPQQTPAPQYGPQSGGGAPHNGLGLAAFIIAAVGGVLGSAIAPFVIRAISTGIMMTYNRGSIFFLQWADVFIFAPLFIVALALGIAGAQPRRAARGKGLAFMAIGGAALGLIMVVVGSLANSLTYGNSFILG